MALGIRCVGLFNWREYWAPIAVRQSRHARLQIEYNTATCRIKFHKLSTGYRKQSEGTAFAKTPDSVAGLIAIELLNKCDGVIFGEIYRNNQEQTPTTFHHNNVPVSRLIFKFVK